MAPKVTCSAPKLALALNYFHKHPVAFTLKDLEKPLSSKEIGISGMQVKDYLDALRDECQIHVEKIGSGNWYWAFPGEAKETKEAALERVNEERDKVAAIVADLQAKVEDATASREEDETTRVEHGQDRTSLMARYAELVNELEPLQVELASYSLNDPAEVEKAKQEAAVMKVQAEQCMEQIQCMEGKLKEWIGGSMDRDSWLGYLRNWYGDQYDEENQCLREVV